MSQQRERQQNKKINQNARSLKKNKINVFTRVNLMAMGRVNQFPWGLSLNLASNIQKFTLLKIHQNVLLYSIMYLCFSLFKKNWFLSLKKNSAQEGMSYTPNSFLGAQAHCSVGLGFRYPRLRRSLPYKHFKVLNPMTEITYSRGITSLVSLFSQ